AALGFGTIAHETVRGFLQDDRVQIIAVADPAKDLSNYGYRGEKRGGREVGKAIIENHYGKAEGGGKFAGCKTYENYMELLEKEDIDAVNVSAPDHWHAHMAIYCARKGKHIYGQKPLALTVEQGRRMSDEVKKAGVTWQTGSQQRSDQYFRMAAEFVRNGRLGKLQGISVGLPGGRGDWNQMGAQQDPRPAPEGLNYDLWEGPAPHRPYCPAILPLNWRHNWDYSGGMITDWGAHHIDIVQWALGMDESGPVKIENIKGEMPDQKALYNTPEKFHFEVVYADGLRMTVQNKETGITFNGEGDKSIFVKRGTIRINPRELAREKIKDSETQLYASKNHYRDFVDGIYSGGATAAPIEAAHRTITIAHLANIALRLGKGEMSWDPKTEKSDDDAINQMLSRPMRGAYSI
ncbi:MAG: Gfo/Idh/MocA family protein, partial [Verrucomicrobiales bacterium]